MLKSALLFKGALAFLLLFAACDSAEDGDPGDDDVFAPGCEGSQAVLVNPTGTYFRTHPQDQASAPLILRLADFGLAPGHTVLLERFGEYQYQGRVDPTLTREAMVGVFSSSSAILAQDQPARVPGAINAGEDFVTRPTLLGNLPTDIPEDFEIDSTTVVVPPGAVYLFVSPNDDFFEDNIDEDRDYRVCLTRQS